MRELVRNYVDRLAWALSLDAMEQVPALASALREAWRNGRSIYLCGNGGSAGNAIHIRRRQPGPFRGYLGRECFIFGRCD